MVSSMNFQNFSGERLTEPSPQTPPRAQSQVFAVVSRALCVLG